MRRGKSGAGSAQQLVGDARLARAAGAGDADHRRLAPAGRCLRRRASGARRAFSFLDGGSACADGAARCRRGDARRGSGSRGGCLGASHAGHQVVDHPLQAHRMAVVRVSRCARRRRPAARDLGRHDHAAAAAEHLDVRGAALAQQVDHVLEVLDVAALVGADGDALGVLLQRGA
jgi:hypothetical protein